MSTVCRCDICHKDIRGRTDDRSTFRSCNITVETVTKRGSWFPSEAHTFDVCEACYTEYLKDHLEPFWFSV